MPRRRKIKGKDEPTYVRKPFDIPYFAHQPLDPERFPEGTGLPIGGPPSSDNTTDKNENIQDWDDSEDDDMMPEDDEELIPNMPKSKQVHFQTDLDPDTAPCKRVRVDGGRPAIAKKITADLDSDDELIVRMKDAKYLEKDIAQRLVDEGRIRYNSKTIGTRYLRIQRVLQKKQDELLDAELSDWHEGDDDVLEQAVRNAEKELDKQIEQLRTKKWRMVATDLKELKPVTNFSPNACEKRFVALKAGTAKATPEAVVDPDEKVLASIRRRKDKEARITEDCKKQTIKQENMAKNGWNSRTAHRLGR